MTRPSTRRLLVVYALVLVLIWLVLAIPLLSCAPLSTIGTTQGPASLCSKDNLHPYRIDIYLEDSEGRSEWVGWADPQGHVCTTWTMPGAKGRWVFVSDFGVERGLWFQAWALR